MFMLLFSWCEAGIAQSDAEEQKKKPTVERFETVIVTADPGRAEIPESPTTIAEVTAEQLEQRSVANIGQALELLPGVQFRVARSKSEEQVTIRGFEQEKLLILMDGIPVSLPYEGQINLADIPVQNIASIKCSIRPVKIPVVHAPTWSSPFRQSAPKVSRSIPGWNLGSNSMSTPGRWGESMAKWFKTLNAPAAAEVATALIRIYIAS